MKTNRPTRRLTRGNPLLQEKIHDPYRAHEKLRGASGCPQCGARYRNGRWMWPKSQGGGFRREICPACRRINDRYPAGELTVAGSFPKAHSAEVLATVRRVADLEGNQHPLHRIMQIVEDEGGLRILTTDVHLPHRIAHALKDAWGGAATTHYDLDGYFARTRWERND